MNKENKDCMNCEKDWCECFKAHIKKVKKQWRDKNVIETLSLLNENNIEFVESKMSNIVILNPETDKVFLSLKKKNRLFKCRYNGSNKWYTFTREKLIQKFATR